MFTAPSPFMPRIGTPGAVRRGPFTDCDERVCYAGMGDGGADTIEAARAIHRRIVALLRQVGDASPRDEVRTLREIARLADAFAAIVEAAVGGDDQGDAASGR